jgi:ATP synthase F1 gamma subunit
MRQLNDLAKEIEAMGTMANLTSAFEGIASMKIAQIKDQVLQSQQFFADLWKIYTQIRVDEFFHFGRSQSQGPVVDKELLILITSEGSFSGDIDQRLVSKALENYDPKKNDIIVVGHHGAVQLLQRNVKFTRSFKTPQRDTNINVAPIIAEVQRYKSTRVFYESYQSLSEQAVWDIYLNAALTARGGKVEKGEEIISEQTYIFEPSTYAVVDHMERTMMQIMLAEVILESKLAQYASRFKAMTVAKDRADESFKDTTRLYNHAKRHLKDERLKEVMIGLRSAGL